MLLALPGLQLHVFLFGCLGVLAGFAMRKQLELEVRTKRMESQLQIVLQTQRQPPMTEWSPHTNLRDEAIHEDEAYEDLSDS